MRLFDPFTLKNTTLRNRIVMPGMDTNFGDEEGNIHEDTYRYYDLRARGGVGLVIVEAAYFDRRGAGTQNMLCLDSNRRISQFAGLAGTIKKHGARALLQIYHAGSQAASFMMGLKPVAPSDVPFRMSGEVPVPLTRREIGRLVRGYAKACLRARQAGFDGVEIHAGHGYLLNQFFSPLTNKRRDRYGGSFENRTRLHMEVLQAVRKACGEHFIIGYRLNGSDYIQGGIEVDYTCRLARRLESRGVDLINITGGIFDSPGFPVVPYMSYPRGVFSEAAGAVKKALDKTPVCVVGRINTVDAAETVLQQGRADLVAVGRGLLADPFFPAKAREGKQEEIRYCIGCNACLDRIMTEQPVACSINPDLLGEQPELEPAAERKRVLVVGAGIAGMEAARVTRLRGHETVLIEKSRRPGGSLRLACQAPLKSELALLLTWYERQLKELGVDLRLNTPLTPEIIAEIEPNTVVLATGTAPELPAVQGLDACPHSLYTEVLAGAIPPGGRICVLGGGMIGIDTADYLGSLNKTVTIVEPGKRLAYDLYALVAREMEKFCGDNESLRIYLAAAVERIEGNRLVFRKDGRTRTVEFDHLVIASGRSSQAVGLDVAAGRAVDVVRVGDCRKPGLILDALHGAYRSALRIGEQDRQPKAAGEAAAAEDRDDIQSRVARRIKTGVFSLEDVPAYLDVLVSACNRNAKIQKRARKAVLGFQFRIQGGTDFWIRINRGTFSTGRGEIEAPQVTITMDARIAPGIFSGQVNAASAYMAKELSFAGPMKHGIAFRTWINIVKQELGL